MAVAAAVLTAILPLFSFSEEIFEETQIVSDSIDCILDDLRDYADESIIDSIRVLYRSKGGVSYRKILEVSRDEYLAEILSSRLIVKTAAGVKAEAGAFRSDAFDPQTKTFMFFDAYKTDHEAFALAEKDASEKRFYDNWKAGYSWRSFHAGDFRIKTGRGVFSDWSSYFSPFSAPFSSDRVESDKTYNEYTSMRGLSYSSNIAGFMLTAAAAVNMYDASINDSGEVKKVLTYNLHDDSLSISRADNLREIYACGIVRLKGDWPKAAFSYSLYSRKFEMYGRKENTVLDIFGRKGPFSYDFGISGSDGFACSFEMKKEYESVILKSGASGARNFFNLHSRPFMDRGDFFNFYIYMHARKPVPVNVSVSYTQDDSKKTDADLEIALNKNAEAAISFSRRDSEDVNVSAKVSFNASNGRFFLKNTIKFTDSGSGLARVNLTYASNGARLNGFAYIYEVASGDIFSEYEYVNSGVFPMRVLGEGSGFACGFSTSVKIRKTSELSAALSCGSGGRVSGGLTLSVYAGY